MALENINRQNIRLLWLRRDLRVHDNPALYQAVQDALKNNEVLIPLYIVEEGFSNQWPLGGASRTWLDRSLRSLQKSFQALGSDLYFLKGNPQAIFNEFIKDFSVQGVYWNRRYEPDLIAFDSQLKESFHKKNIQVHSFNSHLLVEPWTIKNKSSKPYRVYTAFWKAAGQGLGSQVLLPSPPKLGAINSAVRSKLVKLKNFVKNIDELELRSQLNWDSGFFERFKVGESAALESLDQFSKKSLSIYDDQRNLPSIHGTSRLSPHLAWGEVSVRSVWNQVRKLHVKSKKSVQIEVYLKEIFWREFAYHLLYHYPQTTLKAMDERFNHFPWKANSKLFKKWTRGQTGVPLVDAGMRELWHTGWMHNRVRMVVGSFLVKNLMIPWQDGARWFWDTLVDADLASNTLGWQWVAGCGADAAPYFRVFNPVLQAKRFDPKTEYVKQWVNELKKLSAKECYEPWNAGINTYTEPCIDLSQSRTLVLETWKKFSGKNKSEK